MLAEMRAGVRAGMMLSGVMPAGMQARGGGDGAEGRRQGCGQWEAEMWPGTGRDLGRGAGSGFAGEQAEMWMGQAGMRAGCREE